MSLKEKARQIKKDIPVVFLAMRKSETPWYAKLLAFLTVVYALSPIDLIPDFIPVLGYLDDVLILPGMVALTIRSIPAEVIESCRKESEGMWKNGKPKKWYYALPIVFIWLLLIWVVVRAIWL